jgi:hypothetical protein
LVWEEKKKTLFFLSLLLSFSSTSSSGPNTSRPAHRICGPTRRTLAWRKSLDHPTVAPTIVRDQPSSFFLRCTVKRRGKIKTTQLSTSRGQRDAIMNANNPFETTRRLNVPMLLKQLDLSVGHILHRLPARHPFVYSSKLEALPTSRD